MTLGQRIADKAASVIGSWAFIGAQSALLAGWILLNVLAPPAKRPDPYPFILLNLMLSFQAAYTGPVLLMAANRQAEIDRKRAIENLTIDQDDHQHLLHLAEHIDQHFDSLSRRLTKLERRL